jgi:hypothetical protein
VPIQAFLRRSETNGAGLKHLGTPSLPATLCPAAADFDSEDRVGVRGTVEILVDNNTRAEGEGENPDADFWPVYVIGDTVTVYRSGGAEEFLDEVRAMVKDCPKGENGATYRSLGSLGLGDESVLIEGWSPAVDGTGKPLKDGTRSYSYYAEVRIADMVVSVSYGAYSAGTAPEKVEREDAEELARKAVQRARNWRG